MKCLFVLENYFFNPTIVNFILNIDIFRQIKRACLITFNFRLRVLKYTINHSYILKILGAENTWKYGGFLFFNHYLFMTLSNNIPAYRNVCQSNNSVDIVYKRFSYCAWLLFSVLNLQQNRPKRQPKFCRYHQEKHDRLEAPVYHCKIRLVVIDFRKYIEF